MIVVSDTSVIINLAAIGQLELLPALFKHVIIPKAVFDEIVKNDAKLPGELEVRTASWVEVKQVSDKTILASVLDAQLDIGETEAIALALELKAERLLMDEYLGRELAVKLKLQPIGILGILLEAKHQQIIKTVKPHLEALIQEAHFFIHQSLYERVLSLAKEVK